MMSQICQLTLSHVKSSPLNCLKQQYGYTYAQHQRCTLPYVPSNSHSPLLGCTCTFMIKRTFEGCNEVEGWRLRKGSTIWERGAN